MRLDEQQEQAVDLCLDSSKRVVAITGAAGTGKTTIISEVCHALNAKGISYGVSAPTGKAARRITQATKEPAVTLHRLLEYPNPGERDPETGKPLRASEPKRDPSNPLPLKVVVCDEYAMVGQELDRNLLDALGRGARLLTFGDINQLPPIEDKKHAGTETPFERHLDRASVTLEHVYRQAGDSDILSNANLIRQGRMPRNGPDFRYAISNDPVAKLVDFVERSKETGVDYGTTEHQIITPQRSTWVGTIALNTRLRDVLNRDGVADYSIELPRHEWDSNFELYVSVGDKVICTENSYDMRDYNERWDTTDEKKYGNVNYLVPCPPGSQMLNGDQGIITQIYGDGALDIEMDDRTVHVPASYAEMSYKQNKLYPVDPRKRIDLAYAVTTHKCQGSEYSRVIYVLNRSAQYLCNRNNFYTAITRAKNKVTVITDEVTLHKSLKPIKR